MTCLACPRSVFVRAWDAAVTHRLWLRVELDASLAVHVQVAVEGSSPACAPFTVSGIEKVPLHSPELQVPVVCAQVNRPRVDK